MIKSYEDLKVYRMSYESSLKIHRMSLTLPQIEQQELGRQIRRATKSIPMNIAEGYGKKSSAAEFKRYITMALGSNNEVLVQLKYCLDLEYITETEYRMHESTHVEIGKMLSGILSKWH